MPPRARTKKRTARQCLIELSRRTDTMRNAERRQIVAAVLAIEAGASYADVAEASGLGSRQHAHQRFSGWQTDGEHLWRQEAMTAKKSTARQARGTVS